MNGISKPNQASNTCRIINPRRPSVRSTRGRPTRAASAISTKTRLSRTTR
jgi:hypothetical protein